MKSFARLCRGQMAVGSSDHLRCANRPPAESADGDPNFMTSLSRGLAVIRAFSQHRKKLSIAQISHHTGIPRAASPWAHSASRPCSAF